MTENQALGDHDIAVGIAWYHDLVRPVADGHPDGFFASSSPTATPTPFSAPSRIIRPTEG